MRPRYAARAGVLLVLVGTVGLALLLHPMDAGAIIRISAVGRGPAAVAVDARTGRAFVTNAADNTVSVLDSHSGTVLRTVGALYLPNEVVIDERTGRAFVLNSTSGVSVLDTTQGAVLATVSLYHATDEALDERSGHVFVVAGSCDVSGKVYVLDARSGRLLRVTPVGAYPWMAAIDTRRGRVFVPNSLDNTLSVLDAASGRVLRTVNVGVSPKGVVVDEPGGHVYVANTGGHTVSVLDAATGAVLQTVVVGNSPQSMAVASRAGRVFVVNEADGTLSVLDARLGTVLRTVTLSGGQPDDRAPGTLLANLRNMVVDERHAHAFVLRWDGTDAIGTPLGGSVSVLDARSGRLLHRILAGRAPLALALDDSTAHLFVTSQGRGGTGSIPWGGVAERVRNWLPWLTRPSTPAMTGSVTMLDTARL